MLKGTKEELQAAGASITTQEIVQQPRLWEETLTIYKTHEKEIQEFIETFSKESHGKVRIIFAGAGTSAYVGDVVRPHLMRYGKTDAFIYEAIPTTDIAAAPYDYLLAEVPTILVSFARSGNSPESVATIDLANQVVKNLRHLIITCAPDGKLAQNAQGDKNSLVVLMPADANDQGFAMTGSFSCMTLTALLTFDETHKNHDEMVTSMINMGNKALETEESLVRIVAEDFNRVVYLGSGSLSGLTREAQLKLLELTAGQVTTAFDSSLGFRHGPKSFVDEKTVVFGFVSNDEYTRQYDVDILDEIYKNKIAVRTIAIAQEPTVFEGINLFLGGEVLLPDAYLALPFVMIAQTFALLASLKVGNKPDTPSPTGTVNRVVQGVTIYPLD